MTVLCGWVTGWLTLLEVPRLNGKKEVVCPHCGSSQQEPAGALSTYCRSCGGHIRLQAGNPQPVKRGFGGFIGLMTGKTAPVPEVKPAAPARQPAVPFQLTGYSEQDAPLVARADSLSTSARPNGQSRDRSRHVECFDCQAVHKVAPTATSTICPSCSTYVDLRDLEIKERTAQRIRTRGDVVVQKKGVLLGTSVHCGNIIIHGSVAGSIYASGEVHLKADARIVGEVRCRKLTVERKCEVHFLQPVHAGEAEIHGTVSGHIYADKGILLSRGASLDGSASARKISVDPGATINGQVKVRSSDDKVRPVVELPGDILPA